MPTFECPFCSVRTDLTLERVDSVVSCSACGRPFRAEVPPGKLVEEVDGHWRLASAAAAGEERTIMKVRPDPFRRAPAKALILSLLSLTAVGWVIFYAFSKGTRSVANPAVFLPLLLAFVLLLPLAWDFIYSRFESLTITTERSIWRRGILDKNTSEVQHDDIRNIQVTQDFSDQLLRVGTVSISSAGQNDMEIQIGGMRNPEALVDAVRRYQSRLTGRD